MSMMCRLMWPFLIMYGSHDMRHTNFPQVDGGQWDPRGMGRHKTSTCQHYLLKILFLLLVHKNKIIGFCKNSINFNMEHKIMIS